MIGATDVLKIGADVATIVGVIGLSIAYFALASQRAGHTLVAFRDLVNHEYLDRPIAPDFVGKESASEEKSVRSLRSRAKEFFDGQTWRVASTKDDPKKYWEARLAGDLAARLQRVGIASFSGYFPIRFLLSEIAGQIVNDWILCRDWIENHRSTGVFAVTSSAERIPFDRRHAEWLALLSALWLVGKWHYPRANFLLSTQFPTQRSHAARVKQGWKRLRELRRIDGGLQPFRLRAELGVIRILSNFRSLSRNERELDALKCRATGNVFRHKCSHSWTETR